MSFPRALHEVLVEDVSCVDVTSSEALDEVGLTPDDLVDDNWAACQRVGNAVNYLGIAGLLAPSASGVGRVLTVFEPHVRPGQLRLLGTSEIGHPPT